MTFFGLGGFEVMLIGAIGLFVLGPKRLLEGIREGRKIYSDLKRQRDALQSMITEAIDLEDLKKQVDVDGITEDVKSLEADLALDQVADDVREVSEDIEKSISRDWRSSRAPVEVDADVRDAVPDLNIGGGDESVGSDAAGSKKSESPVEALPDGVESTTEDVGSDIENGGVKS
jgi:Sec-independent protein translocase protein TatA